MTILIDCEASGLSNSSYPIEIAWLDMVSGESDTFLLNPFTCGDWDYWCHHAEKVHGISVKELTESGIAVDDAAERLTVRLSGARVYSDCPAHDYLWIKRLYQAVGCPMPFRVDDVFDLVKPSFHYQFGQQLKHQPRPHRALPDCHAIEEAIYQLPESALLDGYTDFSRMPHKLASGA